MSEVLVKVDNVSKRFCRSFKRSLWYGLQDLGSEIRGRRHGGHAELRRDEFWAVKDVSFELRRGECIGLIGRNGAGKSTLLKMLNGLIKPDQGTIQMHGRVAALIELNAGFNPILTGRENIYISGQILGLTRNEIDKKLDAILEFSELGEFINTPVQNYSSGMKVRLGFAVATQMEPDVLIIDEVLAVGDIGFKIKCLNKIHELLVSSAVIFVSHSMPLVARICSEVMVLRSGSVVCHSSDVGKGMDLYYQCFDAPSAKMSGTGDVEIVSVCCNGKSGDDIFLPIGHDLNIDVVLVVKTPCRVLSLRIGMFNQDQRPVYDVVTPAYERFSWHNSNREVLIKCSIPSLDLSPGKHSIMIAVHDLDKTVVLCRFDNAITFQMETKLSTSADALLKANFHLSDV